MWGKPHSQTNRSNANPRQLSNVARTRAAHLSNLRKLYYLRVSQLLILNLVPSFLSDKMASTKLPLRYRDPVYQETHQSVFQGSLTKPLKELLPPGVSREDFKLAIEEFVSALGSDGVVIGEALSDYVDPYELYEDKDSERKVASAAVL